MTAEATLWELEEKFWTQGADSARSMTAKGAVFVFPYPVGILSGNSLWREAEVAQRWRSIVMDDRHFSRQGKVAVLAYQVSAERDAEAIYEALCTSTYVKDEDGWLRMTHQQTPIAEPDEI